MEEKIKKKRIVSIGDRHEEEERTAALELFDAHPVGFSGQLRRIANEVHSPPPPPLREAIPYTAS